MTRPARGEKCPKQARQMLAQARTVEQLRQAQAVVVLLDHGLSLEQAAQARPLGDMDMPPVQPFMFAKSFWMKRA